jgi:phosphatidylserine decarboxylase
MKGFTLTCVLIILAGIILVASPACRKAEEHQPITIRLINLSQEKPEIRQMLEKSIAGAKKVNPDRETNPVQSLSDYYNFIDRISRSLPNELLGQDALKALSSSTAIDRINQGLNYFVFLIDQPLPELEGQGLYKNSLQFYPPFSSWMRDFAIVRGAFLDTEESWNEKIYLQINNDPIWGLQKEWYEPPSNWKTFNQFFARKLSSPDMRPIASPDDPAVVVSPADSVPRGVWAIDGNSHIGVTGVNVKGVTYYNIPDLLGKDSEYKHSFANGLFTHTFLDVFDYHHYHFAAGGMVKEKEIVQQNVGTEAEWNAEQRSYDIVEGTGWQFTQTRGYVIVDAGKYGLIALMPVGMDEVSSVNFEDSVQAGSTYQKGDMLGNFLFGGSDFVMLFQAKAGFEIVAPMENSTTFKHLLAGEKYGVMRGPIE